MKTQTNKGSRVLITMLTTGFLFGACNGGYQSETYEAVEEVAYLELESLPNNTEEYDKITENPFYDPVHTPLSTFSIDVDNASYSNVRRYLDDDMLPPKDAVRIEEMVNYFTYDYAQPRGEHPFSFKTEISECPWSKETKLLHIGLQGKSMGEEDQVPNNLVFLIDASGSMNTYNKLPLLKRSFSMLLEKLGPEDRVAIVAYAGAAGLVLESTKASKKEKILAALDNIHAGGSTAGGAGIELAYRIARENMKRNGNNRVILATDGDFNVGTTSREGILEIISEHSRKEIFLTICGYGMGNYKDGSMEEISNAGNGNYFYIDNIKEANKVFVNEFQANMFTIAKDVKIQIEFNPAVVKSYRLIGYENRVMADQDFNDDEKDAGELGAGHTVTALYEVVPVGSAYGNKDIDDLKYQENKKSVSLPKDATGEICTIKFRYKPIGEEESKLIVVPVMDENISLIASSDDFRLSAAVAGFGMLLRDSKYRGDLQYEEVLALAKGALSSDKNGYRAEMIGLVQTAALLSDSE